MGLFSSKKKYITNVTVQPIFTDPEQIPKSVSSGVIKAIWSDSEVTPYIMEEVVNSIGVKANNGFGWAKNHGFNAGIPKAAVVSSVSAKTSMLNAISANEGGPITSVYYYFGPMNSLHYAWTWLKNAQGYNPQTNEIVALTNSTGYKCYLTNMVATYTRESYNFIVETHDTGVLDQLGPAPSSGFTPTNPFNTLQSIGQYAAQPSYEVSDTAVDDYVTITYEFKDASGAIIRRGLTLAIQGISDEGDYHQVRYIKPDGTTGFFTYLSGSGTYPVVDAIFNLANDPLGEYYPWMYVRLDGIPIDKFYLPELYADCKKWAKYIGVDYDAMSVKVNQDPDVQYVEQSMLQFGINPGAKDKWSLQYLFKHFSVLHENALTQEEMAQTLQDKFIAYSSSPSQVQSIADKYFRQTLQFSGIHKKRVAGKIGIKGTYTGEYGVVDQNTQNFVEITPTGIGEGSALFSQNAYIYRYQVLDSMYDEIAVYGLRINYEVSSHKGFGAAAGSDSLLIPLDHAIMSTINVRAREQIFCRAMHMLVNTLVIEKTPWYASAGFRIILIAIAVVITVFSAGTAWQTLVAAYALGAAALAITIMVMIAQYVVATYAVKLFVKAVGPEFGFIAAIAAMAYGVYTNVAAADTTSMWGDTLLKLGSSLSKESSALQQTMIEDVVEDINQFQTWAGDQFDALADLRSDLGLVKTGSGLSAEEMLYLQPIQAFNEKPQDYYSRTVHSGNIGTASYDLISNFTSLALTLPTIDDVKEDFVNGS